MKIAVLFFVGLPTCILVEAVLPFVVLAVIVASPSLTPLIFPLVTIATFSLLLDHVTVLSVALVGLNLTVISFSSLTLRVKLVGDTLIDVTGISLSLTLTEIVLVIPLLLFKVTVADPALTPTIFPSLLKPIISLLSILYDTFLLVASSGSIVYSISFSSPTYISILGSLGLISVISIAFFTTVTFITLVNFCFSEVTLIYVVPGLNPLTIPLSKLIILGLPTSHIRF